jgi:hypothetical protein
MSTSCIIALYSKEDDEIVLLEKTHDGFIEPVKWLINEAVSKEYDDLEVIANYLIKNTDIRFSIYSHKYPCQAFIYYVEDKKFETIKINPTKNRIAEYLSEIKQAILTTKPHPITE